jgi:hypothetical protein
LKTTSVQFAWFSTLSQEQLLLIFHFQEHTCDLWEVKSDLGTHFIASHLDGDQIVVSIYLCYMSLGTFDEFWKFLFYRYEIAKLVYILHSYTMWAGLETMEHAHIEFQETVEEFDVHLLHSVNYNTRWYTK